MGAILTASIIVNPSLSPGLASRLLRGIVAGNPERHDFPIAGRATLV